MFFIVFPVVRQEYSLKIKSFQIHTCGHPHGKTAKQSVQVTRLVDTSPGRRTGKNKLWLACVEKIIHTYSYIFSYSHIHTIKGVDTKGGKPCRGHQSDWWLLDAPKPQFHQVSSGSLCYQRTRSVSMEEIVRQWQARSGDRRSRHSDFGLSSKAHTLQGLETSITKDVPGEMGRLPGCLWW